MKYISCLLVGAAALLSSCNGGGGYGNATMASDVDSMSYALGMDIGENIGKSDVELSGSLIASGIVDALENGDLKLTPEEKGKLVAAFSTKAREAQMKVQAEAGQKALAEGQAFLAQNASNPNVQTTASGLQYEIIEPGNGNKPTAENTVRVHYTGTLIDGTKFDSSLDRGQPAEFPLGGVIAGWTEGLQLVGEGGKLKLYIPANLGYGPQGSPPNIPGNSALVFDVELLEIVK